MPTNPVPVLSDDALRKIEARPVITMGGYRRVHLRPSERDALCATVRVLREKYDSLKSKIAWHRDGVGPDVPVLQERYDKLIAQRNKFSELADERHDLLSAEKRANDALRDQLAQSQREAEWQKSTIEQLTVGVTGCAKQLAQVTQERDDLLNRSHQTVLFDCGCMFKQEGLNAEPMLIVHCVTEEQP